jgi:hypothetical protein
MRFQSISFALLVAAVVLPPVAPPCAFSQTVPPGQITRLMQSRPTAPDVKIPPSLADFSDIANPTGTKLGPFVVLKSVQKPNALREFSLDADLSAHVSSVLNTKPVSPQPATVVCSTDSDSDAKMQSAAIGTAAIAAWNEVVRLGKEHPSDNPPEVQAARRVACLITDGLNLDAAHETVNANLNQPGLTQDMIAGITGISNAIPFARSKDHPNGQLCWVTATSSTANGQTSTNKSFVYPVLFPLYRKGCNSDSQILNFFASNTVDAGNKVQYLYNAQQSASTVSGDLLTTTFFPGIQVVLGSAAVAGSGTSPSSSSSSSSTAKRAATSSSTDTSNSTDTVQTALAKLENGGDFNLRVPVPLLSHTSQSKNWSVNGFFLPNFGMTLNNFASQQTITGSTEYSGNFPVELYGQIGSVSDPSGKSVPAVGFVDFRAAGEWISPALATKLGSTGSDFFPILQASAGIEFAQKFRISMQYIYSSSQFCQVSGGTTCSTGAATSSTNTSLTKINGFHFAVSFSSQKSKSQNSSN